MLRATCSLILFFLSIAALIGIKALDLHEALYKGDAVIIQQIVFVS